MTPASLATNSYITNKAREGRKEGITCTKVAIDVDTHSPYVTGESYRALKNCCSKVWLLAAMHGSNFLSLWVQLEAVRSGINTTSAGESESWAFQLTLSSLLQRFTKYTDIYRRALRSDVGEEKFYHSLR